MKPFRQAWRFVEETGSTNADLMEANLTHLSFGSSLAARRQSAGRGRAGRAWESGPGGLYISTLLHPSQLAGLCMLGALTVVKVVESYGVEARIRWPNDVYVDASKLAGVLPQARFQGGQLERAVLGVGLNVAQDLESFPAPLRPTVTTLSHLIGRTVELEEVAGRYLGLLETEYLRLESEGCADLARRCEPLLQGRGSSQGPVLTRGAEVTARLAPITGLGPEGQLLLADGTELESLGPEERLRI